MEEEEITLIPDPAQQGRGRLLDRRRWLYERSALTGAVVGLVGLSLVGALILEFTADPDEYGGSASLTSAAGSLLVAYAFISAFVFVAFRYLTVFTVVGLPLAVFVTFKLTHNAPEFLTALALFVPLTGLGLFIVFTMLRIAKFYNFGFNGPFGPKA